MKKKISIVTPTFNEETNIERLSIEIEKEMNLLNYDYEHIIIDNCSTDNTQKIISSLCAKNQKIKAIFNKKNYGHIKSPFYGLMQAEGDAVILLASDFQDPIELIPKLIEKWKNGSEVVMLQRKTTKRNYALELVKKTYYKFLAKISEEKLTESTTGSGIFDKKIILELKKIEDPYPYLRGLISEFTNTIDTIQFNQPNRLSGKTKNNFYTLFDIGLLGIVKHSKLPLRVKCLCGFIFSTILLLVGIVYFVYKLLFWDTFQLGLAPIIIGLFFGISFQIFFLGFVGEYIINILIHVRNLPLVIEKERINFTKKN